MKRSLTALSLCCAIACGVQPGEPVQSGEDLNTCVPNDTNQCNTGPTPHWHNPPSRPPVPTYQNNDQHTENFDYSNGCFGACGAACSKCTAAINGHTEVCTTSSACQWHDTCYQECNGDKWCQRSCDIGCIENFGVAACLNGLAGFGDYVACFDTNFPNTASWRPCTDASGHLYMNAQGQYYDPGTGHIDTADWPAPGDCPHGYVPSGPNACTYTVDTGCIGAECVGGSGGAYAGDTCSTVSALVGFNWCEQFY